MYCTIVNNIFRQYCYQYTELSDMIQSFSHNSFNIHS